MKQRFRILLVFLVFTSCGNDDGQSGDPSTDSDTDTDTDTDSDSDTDSESDTETETETDSTPPPGCEGVLSFPDSNLESAIRQAVYKPDGDIYYADVWNLTELTADCGS